MPTNNCTLYKKCMSDESQKRGTKSPSPICGLLSVQLKACILAMTEQPKHCSHDLTWSVANQNEKEYQEGTKWGENGVAIGTS